MEFFHKLRDCGLARILVSVINREHHVVCLKKNRLIARNVYFFHIQDKMDNIVRLDVTLEVKLLKVTP